MWLAGQLRIRMGYLIEKNFFKDEHVFKLSLALSLTWQLENATSKVWVLTMCLIVGDVMEKQISRGHFVNI